MPIPHMIAAKAGYGIAKKLLGSKHKGAVHGRRRRRARLTHRDITELTHIKNILGKTAAANALPFYLGRR